MILFALSLSFFFFIQLFTNYMMCEKKKKKKAGLFSLRHDEHRRCQCGEEAHGIDEELILEEKEKCCSENRLGDFCLESVEKAGDAFFLVQLDDGSKERILRRR